MVYEPGERTFDETPIVPPVVMRTLRDADMDMFEALIQETFTERYSRDMFELIIGAWPEGTLVAVAGDELVGLLMGTLQRPVESRVLLLATRMGWESMGIGSALLEEFTRRSLARGVMAITLEVRVSNVRAIRFYQRRGFILAGIIPNFYQDGTSGYYMRKEI